MYDKPKNAIMNFAIPNGKISTSILFLCLLIFYSCSSNYKFGELAKHNKIYQQMMYYFTNDSAAINFETLGDYDFYNNKNFKPTKEFNRKLIPRIKKNNYEFLTIAETWTAPYYMFCIQYKKNENNIFLDTSLRISKIKNFEILNRNISNEKFTFLFSFFHDKEYALDFWEHASDHRIEFDDIIHSISFTKKIYNIDSFYQNIPFSLAKEDPLRAIQSINKINLDSLPLDMADMCMQIKTTAWAFMDELDSATSNETYRFKYTNNRMGIELNQMEMDSVKNSAKELINDNNAEHQFYQDAKNARAVIINESHNDWRHRQNVSLMIDSLHDIGFEYLAMEALNDGDIKKLNRRKYPIQTTGFYTSEPYFANLIRKAAAKGFTFIGYEDNSDRREEGQAKNIHDFLKKNPNRKLVVYCGWDHISQDTNEVEPNMARLLEKKYKIPIVTLNQTKYMNATIQNKNDMNQPYLILKSNQFKNNSELYNDYYLINFDRNVEKGNLKLFDLTGQIIPPEKFPVVVKIYNLSELTRHKKDAVPLFTKFLNSTEENFNFNFDNRIYKVGVENIDGLIWDDFEGMK